MQNQSIFGKDDENDDENSQLKSNQVMPQKRMKEQYSIPKKNKKHKKHPSNFQNKQKQKPQWIKIISSPFVQ